MSRYTSIPLNTHPGCSQYTNSQKPLLLRAETAEPSAPLTYPDSDSVHSASRKLPKLTWAYITLPLFLHLIFSLGITLLVLVYVNHNNFSLVHRTVTAVLLDGSTQQLENAHFRLLQSDITTILSFSLAINRLLATVWCGSLCWRCAIILMERSGLSLGELGRMVSYGLPPFRWQPLPSHQDRGTAYTSVVVLILLLVLPVQFASPVITGSITWAPSSEYYNAPNQSVIVRHLRDDGQLPTLDSSFIMRSIVTSAGASGFRIWQGVDKESDAMQRVLGEDSARLLFTLPANSTLNNITMPYFKVKAFEWIGDPERTLTPDQLGVIDTLNPARWTNVSVEFNPLQMLSSVAIAATPQELFTSRQTTQTQSVVFVATSNSNTCTWDRWNFSKTVPTDAGFAYRKFPSGIQACYVFANVTFDVGAMTCTSCQLAFPGSTVQTDPNPDSGTFRDDVARPKAMAMMAEIAYEITTLSNYANVPQSAWPSVEAYVSSVLRRSYMAGWNQVQSGWNAYPELQTGVSLPVEFSQGQVDQKRVWAWFALQMLVTASGILFMVVQVRVDRAPVKDTALVGLFLDTRDLAEYDDSLANTMAHIHKGTVISLRREGSRLLPRVEIE